MGVVYFAFWYMAFYFAYTIFVIPYLAWANEFTNNSKDKIFVFSTMSVVQQGGGALFYFLPLLPFFVTTDITPEVLRAAVFFGGGLLLLGSLIAIKVVPDGPKHYSLTTIDSQGLGLMQKAGDVVTTLIRNKPFVTYLWAFICLGIGVGMWKSLFFIYVDIYLQLGTQFAKLSLWGVAVGALSIPVWYRLALIWGKRETWLIAMALLVIVFIGTGLLKPGFSGYGALFSLNMLMTFTSGSVGVVAMPMLCDVIDYGRVKEGVERNALYFSIYSLLTKVQIAIGGALGFAVIGWFGFDVLATQQTAQALLGLKLSISWIPISFVLLAMVFIALMPLNEKKMEVVRRRLADRDKKKWTGT